MLEFERVDFCNVDTTEYNSFSNKSIFTTIEWIEFIAEDSNAEPIIIRISQNKRFVGYFSALAVNKYGVKIIASPFSGWSTCFMGFDIHEGRKIEIVQSLSEYLINTFKCLYMEIIDRDISLVETIEMGFLHESILTLELNIAKSDEELFKIFKTDCRNYIRQFERRGAILEEAISDEKFAEEYYGHLCDVFAKQGMVPTYSLEKVKRLLSHLSETGMLLCLRVKDPSGVCIASSIFVGYNNKFFFWGGASLRQYQFYRPNEYMIWYAIKYWRNRGFTLFDMVGVRDYKKKFGAQEKEYAKIVISKYKILILLRICAKYIYFAILKVKGYLLQRE